MDIVRFKIFDKKYRFSPFTVKEYRDLLLVRAELEQDSTALDDLLEYMFPDIDHNYRWFAFMRRYIATVGKDKIKMKYKCSSCEKSNLFIFNIKTDSIEYKKYDVRKTNLRLILKPSVKTDISSLEFLDNIYKVVTDDKEYIWDDMSDDDKKQIYNSIDLIDINNMKDLSLLSYEYKTRCCNERIVKIYNFIDLYKILFTIDEIFDFYKTNRILTTKGYSNNDLMDMLYVERTIALSLIHNEEKK